VEEKEKEAASWMAAIEFCHGWNKAEGKRESIRNQWLRKKKGESKLQPRSSKISSA